nr:MAG TPA: hypothetical protein [Caudoviricetes sp.]
MKGGPVGCQERRDSARYGKVSEGGGRTGRD